MANGLRAGGDSYSLARCAATRDIGARLLNRSLSPLAALGQNSLQRLMQDDVIEAIQGQQQHHGGDGAEQ